MITYPEIRLIGSEGEQIGVVPTTEAQQIAKDAQLDLVEVSPNAEPPVCRIMDYGKYRFEQKKSSQSARKKQRQTHIKEMKFRPGTDVGDYKVKLRNLIRFLNDGDKAKVTVRYRGREMAHQELGMQLLDRIEADLIEYGVVEQRPKMEGRQLVMIFGPRVTAKKGFTRKATPTPAAEPDTK